MIVPHYWVLRQVVSSNFLQTYQDAFFANFIVFHLFPSKFVHPPSESLVEIPFQLALVYINSHLLHSSQTNIVFHNRDRVFISSVAAFPKLFQYSEHIFVQFCSALFSLFSFLYFLFCYFFQFFLLRFWFSYFLYFKSGLLYVYKYSTRIVQRKNWEKEMFVSNRIIFSFFDATPNNEMTEKIEKNYILIYIWKSFHLSIHPLQSKI